MPFFVNREGFADLANPEHIERIARRLVERHPGGLGRPFTIEEARKQMADPANIQNGRVTWAVEPIIEAAKEAGFTGIPVHENWGKWGWPDAHSLAIFKPENMRPVYERSGSNDFGIRPTPRSTAESGPNDPRSFFERWAEGRDGQIPANTLDKSLDEALPWLFRKRGKP
jgi:hypothetical protein